jgi:hypothetical protein
MLPVQNSGQNLKSTASIKNPVQNEYPKKERKGGNGRETKSKSAGSGLSKSASKKD